MTPPACTICGETTGDKRVHTSLTNGSAHEDCAEKMREDIDYLREPGESFFDAHRRIMKGIEDEAE